MMSSPTSQMIHQRNRNRGGCAFGSRGPRGASPGPVGLRGCGGCALTQKIMPA
jgi:hypothetical protein